MLCPISRIKVLSVTAHALFHDALLRRQRSILLDELRRLRRRTCQSEAQTLGAACASAAEPGRAIRRKTSKGRAAPAPRRPSQPRRHEAWQDLPSLPARPSLGTLSRALCTRRSGAAEGTALLMFSVELLFLGTLTLHTVLLCHIDIRQNIVRRKCPFSLDRPAALRAWRHGLRRCRP